MRYILNSNGYLQEVSFGADILCDGAYCTEYTGKVPSGYDDLVDWFIKEGDKLYRWQIVEGQLTLDSSVAIKSEPGAVFAPAGYGLGTVHPSVIYSTEELDACRTCGFYCYVYAGTICGIYFDYANLTVYSIWGNECVQELRPLNTNYCFRRFYFEGAWSAWEQAGMMTQILWVNASPTSNFAAQTIHMNLSNYKAVYVQSVRSTDDQTISGGTLAWVDIGSNYLTGTTDQHAATRRKVTATSSGITFSGFSSANTSNGASNEIPWVICGIRGISW